MYAQLDTLKIIVARAGSFAGDVWKEFQILILMCPECILQSKKLQFKEKSYTQPTFGLPPVQIHSLS